MNQVTTSQKTNPCYIGKDILPLLKRREEVRAKYNRARRLYWQQNVLLLVFCVFAVFTIIGVLGGLQTASLGLNDLAVTFFMVGLGSALMMFCSWLVIGSIIEQRDNLSSEGYDYGDE